MLQEKTDDILQKFSRISQKLHNKRNERKFKYNLVDMYERR